MRGGSIAARAALALLLMVGFYLMALGMVAGLLYIPYAEWTYAGRLHMKVALGCILGAGAIGLAIIPRPDRFDDPGPELTAKRFPLLFERLSKVAQRSEQSMPRHVYLVPDMNAFVANRGGVMGFGSRRVMGIGLPLMQVLSVSQLEAVLAHEFGHYHGGDTMLGPWVYKTRAAIGRTLSSLGDEGILHLPFRWYGNMFLRLTLAVSRAQEYAADRLAATLVGSGHLAEGLKRVHAAAPAFDAYWSDEAAPVLEGGYRVPLMSGFHRFLAVPKIEEAMGGFLKQALAEEQTEKYDTHPALKDRLAALEDLPAGEPDDGRPAVTLLGDTAGAEQLLLEFLGATDLTSIAWEQVGQSVLLPRWQKQVQGLGALLEGTPLAETPRTMRDKQRDIVDAFIAQPGLELPADVVDQLAANAVGAALCVTLARLGFELDAPVGEPVVFRRGQAELQPFALTHALVSPDAEEAAFLSALSDAGVADQNLSFLE